MTLRVEVTPGSIETAPGDAAFLTVEVHNTSDVIVACGVKVLGLDPSWVQLDQATLSLFPAASGFVTVIVQVPASFAAGRHELGVQVFSRADPTDYQIVPVALDLAEAPAATSRLEPPTIMTGRRGHFELLVANTGNTILHLRPDASDPEQRLSFDFEPPELVLAPGDTAVGSVAVKGARPWFGSPEARLLDIGVVGPSVPRISNTATMMQRPVFSRGLLSLIGLLAAVTVFATVLTSAFSDVVAASKVDPDLLQRAIDGNDPEGDQVSGAQTGVAGTASLRTSGDPVAGVTIELYAADDQTAPVATAATGGDGAFLVTNIGPGDYRVRFVGAGFVEVWYPDAVGFDGAEDVTVETGTTTEGIDVALGGQPGSIAGKVLADDPVGTLLRLLLPAGESGGDADAEVATASAASDGTFRFEDVPAPATYRLEAHKDGFARESRLVTLQPAEERQGIELLLREGDGAIEGVVVGPGGPLGGVSVSATDGAVDVTTTSLTTDQVGTFALRDLVTPGTYTLTFHRDGFRDEVRSVNLTEGQQLSGLSVALTGGAGTLSGLVREAGGAALGGVTVTASNGQVEVSTTTLSVGEIGRYTLVGLPAPSTYTVTFSHPGYVVQSRAADIDPLRNPAVDGIDASLVVATATITGTVSDQNGPASGVKVTVSDGLTSYTSVSADQPPGSYRVGDLRPGTYTVTFSRPGSSEQTFLANLAPAETRVVDVTMEVRASIAGLVTDSLGRPMQGAEVRLYLAVQFPNTPLRRIVTGSDGRYRFDDLSAPEQYVVEFASTPDSPGEASAQVDRAAGQQTPDVNHQFAGR